MVQTRSQRSAEFKIINPHSLFVSKEQKKPVTSVVERARQTQVLINAIGKEDYSLMLQALKNGADPDYSTTSEGSFLMRAIKKENMEMVKMLLEYKADVNKKAGLFSNTALHIAVCSLNLESVFYLLEQGADPRIKNANSSTPVELMKTLEEPVSDELMEDTLHKRAKELDEADKEAKEMAIKKQADYLHAQEWASRTSPFA